MSAIILSAGQGRRLLPLTADLPKCLLRIQHRSVLEWQLRALADVAVERVTVVVGFAAGKVEAEIAHVCPPGLEVQTCHNPFYDRSDNLVSCLAARDAMQEDFLLINGDTLFQPPIVSCLQQSDTGPVALAVARKLRYDEDDMKVRCTRGRVRRVGKDLHRNEVDGEAIGLSVFRGDGPRLFVDALERIASEPDAHKRWYLSAINLLAQRGLVWKVGIDGFRWIEIDYAHDLARARRMMPFWTEEPQIADVPLTAATAE